MKSWEELYKDRGVIQDNVSGFVKEAAEFFRKQGLKRILDLGCGTGRHTIYLLREGFRVYGCDSSETALGIVREKLLGVEFQRCDMTALPYKKGFFDGILCHQVIQHGKKADIEEAVSEIHRVLRKDGVLFLSTISTKHPTYGTGREIELNTKIDTDALDGRVPHHFFTEEEIRDLFRDFDLIRLDHMEDESELNPEKKYAAYILYARMRG